MLLVLEVSVNRIPSSTLKDSTDTMRFMHLNFTNTNIKIKLKKKSMYQHCPLKHKEDPMPRVQQLYLKNCDPNDKAIINLRAK